MSMGIHSTFLETQIWKQYKEFNSSSGSSAWCLAQLLVFSFAPHSTLFLFILCESSGFFFLLFVLLLSSLESVLSVKPAIVATLVS